MKFSLSSIALLLVSSLSPNMVSATNITIFDGTAGGQFSGTNSSQGIEDQEVEPGMEQNQQWDLEGFFLDKHKLSLVGGYDFEKGKQGYLSGDIFISIDADYGTPSPPYTNGNNEVNSNYGYEFVIDLNFGNNEYNYDVYDIRSKEVLTKTAYYLQNQDNNPSSNPWQYVSGGKLVEQGSFVFQSGLTDYQTGFLGDTRLSGGTHYSISGFDLSFLSLYIPGQKFYTHFTMGCGNDNLMGSGVAHAPEPGTMILFGTGLAGLAGVARRRRK